MTRVAYVDEEGETIDLTPEDAEQVLAREDAAHRVVRVAEEEHARERSDRPLEGIHVDRVAAVGAAHEVDTVPRHLDVVGQSQDGRVDGQQHQDTLTGARDRSRRHVEAGDDAGQEHQRLRRDLPAVALQQPVAGHLVELRLLGAVTEEAVLHPLAKRPDHGLGRWEIHVGDPEGQDVRRELVPLVALGAAAVDDAVEVVGHGMEG